MEVIKYRNPIIGEEDGPVPKGWHLSSHLAGDYTLCGLDYLDNVKSKEGKVTCKDCKTIINLCRNKDIKMG